jgi:hypothetical protein
MAEKLVVVEDAFPARSRGTLIRPAITADRAPGASFAVRLRSPNGAERNATAALEVSHVRGPLPPMAMLRILDATPDDLPPGTEIWTVTPTQE